MPDPGEPTDPNAGGQPPGDPARDSGARDAPGLTATGSGGAQADNAESSAPALRHLRAAQLRARAVRGGLVKVAFGTVFLVGALAHSLSPERHESSSLFWMTLLVLMSTVNIALGFRSFGRARRRAGRAWLFLAGAWGSLAVVLLGLLLRR